MTTNCGGTFRYHSRKPETRDRLSATERIPVVGVWGVVTHTRVFFFGRSLFCAIDSRFSISEYVQGTIQLRQYIGFHGRKDRRSIFRFFGVYGGCTSGVDQSRGDHQLHG